MNWVRLKKLTELSGITKHAIYAYIKKGVWLHDKHYRKVNGRLFFNVKQIEKWIEGKAA